ncbi:MAG: hypothetical protein JL50_04525 [Peptococcaceae bacterium BICA1-7]|nr:MAG: hypothetical protein JL50_04525 [Peptococcaceae bacterium BICA1-7]HBV95889.1 hypothetical protein [Desulfotomaculum sp.]
MKFDYYIGIDYSGAESPESRLKGLQVYVASRNDPERVKTPVAPKGHHWNWSRREVAEWLIKQVKANKLFIACIDHGFSFPLSYYKRYGLNDWDAFIDDFQKYWPTHEDYVYVEKFREGNFRTGHRDEFRLTERWTSSAKSVFQFDVQGQVAKSTHAGIPWLYHIRQEVGEKVHFWPFDGFDVPKGKCVISEVYPSVFRNRYPREKRTADKQDAYSIARWLKESDERNILQHYFHPPLTLEEKQIAFLEGWILGIS